MYNYSYFHVISFPNFLFTLGFSKGNHFMKIMILFRFGEVVTQYKNKLYKIFTHKGLIKHKSCTVTLSDYVSYASYMFSVTSGVIWKLLKCCVTRHYTSSGIKSDLNANEHIYYHFGAHQKVA
jgi:hypothetical protein